MTDNLPVPVPAPIAVAEARDAIAEAKTAGDGDAANIAYAQELDALRGEPSGVDGPALAETWPVPSSADTYGILGQLAEIDPDGADSLRSVWAGGDMSENLGAAEWLAQTYLPAGTDMQIDAGLFRVGAVVGRGLYADIRAGNSMDTVYPVSADLAERFLAGFADDEPDALSRWRATLTDDSDFRAGLGAVQALMQRYSVPADHLPDSVSFWKAALPAAQRIVRELRANAPATTENQTMAEAEFNAAIPADRVNQFAELPDESYQNMSAEVFATNMDALRERTGELTTKDYGRAKRLYAREQEIIGARNGNQPVVGAHGRTA